MVSTGYTSRRDFPDPLPAAKTQYCWLCRAPGARKTGTDPVAYVCQVCGRTAERVLIYDPNMVMRFDGQDRLVHESAGVFVTRSDSKLLMYKRTKFPYLLTATAGHVETGEDPLTCAIRETVEEIGIQPKNLIKLYEGDIIGDSCLGGADIHHWNAYGCTVEGTVDVRLDAEGSSWGWYDIDELTDDNTVQYVRYLLRDKAFRTKLQALASR